ncbi:MAG: hypothetical protein WBC72_18945, partial [Pseudolabrys sp.]
GWRRSLSVLQTIPPAPHAQEKGKDGQHAIKQHPHNTCLIEHFDMLVVRIVLGSFRWMNRLPPV